MKEEYYQSTFERKLFFLMVMENLIKNNFKYFNENILGNYYIFTTNSNKSIVIKVEKENLAHLLGIQYSSFLNIARYSASRFYKEMSNYINGKPSISSLYDLISKEKDMQLSLTKNEIWCKDRNLYFIELFSSLNKKEYELRIYRNNNSKDFKTDYLEIKVLNNSQTFGNIGILGDDNDNYFKFNSIIIDKGEKRESSNYIQIKKFEIIKAENFNETDYTFMPSPQFKPIKNDIKFKKFTFDNKSVNYINRLISPLILIKGSNRKGNYQLRKSKEILESNFEKLQSWTSKEEIIKYINENYKATQK